MNMENSSTESPIVSLIQEGCWKRGIMEECRTIEEQCLVQVTPHKPLGATEEELALCHPVNWPDGLETHY